MIDNLRTETIQVAAVAAAMAEDFKYGMALAAKLTPAMQHQGFYTVWQVFLERQRQDLKWGPQHHEPAVWLTILMEEVAELAAEIELAGLDMDLWAFVRRIASTR